VKQPIQMRLVRRKCSNSLTKDGSIVCTCAFWRTLFFCDGKMSLPPFARFNMHRKVCTLCMRCQQLRLTPATVALVGDSDCKRYSDTYVAFAGYLSEYRPTNCTMVCRTLTEGVDRHHRPSFSFAPWLYILILVHAI
jgi:hypothetical protein